MVISAASVREELLDCDEGAEVQGNLSEPPSIAYEAATEAGESHELHGEGNVTDKSLVSLHHIIIVWTFSPWFQHS